MSLDTKRQAMLDSCCHVYEKLFSELDRFDDLSAEDVSGIDCYSIVRVCFDPAIQEFGNNPPSSDDKLVLIEDLLNKIGGLFSFKFSNNLELLAFYQDLKKDILNSASVPANKIENFNDEAKKLSQTCYAQYCNSGYSGLSRDSNLIISPNNNTTVSCIPQKTTGISEVHLKFGTPDFSFTTYANLPFYFFHEYLSHIHTGRLFTEHNYEQTSAFEDGWLVYVGYQEFMKYLQSSTDSIKILLLPHKEHYIKKYINSIAYGEEGNRYTQKGYDLAMKFDQLIGKDLFNKISFLLSSTNYDAISEYNPLHSKFLIIVNKWLRQNLPIQKKEDLHEKIDLLALAVDDENPIKSLLDVMQ